jgi:SAM-dependent methyltransferase
MSPDTWELIAQRMNEHSYMAGVERTRERVQLTAEVFTPTELVLKMVRRLPLEAFAPGKTVLDPACGDGQFLVAAKWVKVFHHGMPEHAALEDIFGVDIMRDNVDLCKKRLGGGTIVMGDTLNPSRRLKGQTKKELQLMNRLFGSGVTEERLFA